MSIKPIFPILCLLLLAVSCKKEAAQEAVKTPGIDLSMMDQNADPRQDFYRFANGGWLDKTAIPSDRGSWGAFDELAKQTNEKVQAVLIDAKPEDYKEGSDQAKALLFFQVAMDTNRINDLGVKPLQAEMDKIDAINDLAGLQQYLTASADLGTGAFFSFSAFPDLNNSAVNAGVIGAANLGLPNKDYYVGTDDETLRIQGEYQKHISRVFSLCGDDTATAEAKAKRLFALEQRLAEPMYNKIQNRNPLLFNNPRSVADLSGMLPSFDWKGFFQQWKLQDLDSVLVFQPAFLSSLEKRFKEESIEDLKTYTKWCLVNDLLPYLSSDFEQAHFDFYNKVLGGVEQMPPRQERVVEVCNEVIGEALGKLYVDAYFPPEAKAVAVELVNDLKGAYAERIKKLEWMSDSTKTKALEKLEKLRVKIAYPDKWKDYGQLSVKSFEDGGSFVGNMLQVSRWNWAENLAKVGKAVDRDEWFLAPQVVNAYYNPLYNEIVFPAAILQPPYYNYQVDAAVNFGGIGGVIGHEISHGFDDQGSRFDAKGNLVNWWTEEDRQRFEAQTTRLAQQYSAYEPIPGVFVNGEFTLGENIGDLGGVNVALDGLQRHLAKHGDPGAIDGFNQMQRFFISWASIWRGKYTDDAMKTQINTNVHAPDMYRAIGPLVNVPAFYEAFGIQTGDPLYKADSSRVVIW
ncbi:MAG TPA: M13 family metallopeptidase [Saprospiraceae bacterium]|nr:M13 family metallopeptidase [Saprospiraceae bacterium]HMQ83269.1 M13 family metallopeptidase [Saprospiraceae bacterium]